MNRFIQMAALSVMTVALPVGVSAGVVVITNSVPLSFGTLISSPAAGTVTISSAGTTTVTGGVIAFGTGASPATFTIAIPQGNPNYTILLPSSATLTGAGGPMAVDSFVSTPGNGGHIRPPTGFQDMIVGATLHLAGNQAAGTYTGTFTVTVTSP